MKTISDETYTSNGKFRVKVMRTVIQITTNCSWRRAKKLSKGMYLNGTHRKSHPKWTNYTNMGSYSRRRRIFRLRTVTVLSNIEHDTYWGLEDEQEILLGT